MNIINNILLLLLFILLIYDNRNTNYEHFYKKNYYNIKDLSNNIIDISMNDISTNDISFIEVDRPIYSYSNYKNDKNDNINSLEKQTIGDIYNELVNDNRIQNINYDNLESYDKFEYFNLHDNDSYGYTNFSTYGKKIV
jgi:hypothetical protein